MMLPLVYDERITRPFLGNVVIQHQDFGMFKVLCYPYEDRSEFYFNVINILTLEKGSINLVDLDKFSTLGVLPPSFTNFDKI